MGSSTDFRLVAPGEERAEARKGRPRTPKKLGSPRIHWGSSKGLCKVSVGFLSEFLKSLDTGSLVRSFRVKGFITKHRVWVCNFCQDYNGLFSIGPLRRAIREA